MDLKICREPCRKMTLNFCVVLRKVGSHKYSWDLMQVDLVHLSFMGEPVSLGVLINVVGT